MTQRAKLIKHPRLPEPDWGVLVVGVLVLGHGVVLYHMSSRLTWWVLLALVLLVLLKHLALLGPSYAYFKRRSGGSTGAGHNG